MSCKPKIIAICSTLILMLSAPALAEFQMSGEDQRPRWESMSDEERGAMRGERKARWDSMSDEERAAMRERRGSDGGRRAH